MAPRPPPQSGLPLCCMGFWVEVWSVLIHQPEAPPPQPQRPPDRPGTAVFQGDSGGEPALPDQEGLCLVQACGFSLHVRVRRGRGHAGAIKLPKGGSILAQEHPSMCCCHPALQPLVLPFPDFLQKNTPHFPCSAVGMSVHDRQVQLPEVCFNMLSRGASVRPVCTAYDSGTHVPSCKEDWAERNPLQVC